MDLRLRPEERRQALEGWWRVADDDGSTVAYVPDKATAERLVGLL